MKKLIALLILIPVFSFAGITPKLPSQDDSYLNEAYPVFLNNCSACHNANTPAINWLDRRTAFDNKEVIYDRVFVKGDMPFMLKWFKTDEREALRKWLLRTGFPFESPEIEPRKKPETKR